MARNEQDLKWRLSADAKGFKKGLTDADKSLRKFQKQSTNLFKELAIGFGAAFSVGMVAEFVKDLAKISGEAEGVGRAFAKIGSVADLQGLRNSVQGTVSDLELMKRAVTASNFGIPVKELGVLLEYAGKVAQDTGQDVDYLVNSIVTGIGRKSPLILDNLGISAVKLKEKLGGLSTEQASVGKMTEAVASIARDYMTEFGGMVDTNATKVARITAEWENFKKSLATSDTFTGVLSELLTEIEMIVTGYAGAGDIAKGIFSDKYWENLTKKFKAFKYNKDQAEKYAGSYGEGESSDGKEKEATVQINTLNAAISSLITKQGELKKQNKDTTDIDLQIKKMQTRVETIKASLKVDDDSEKKKKKEEGAYELLNSRIKELTETRQNLAAENKDVSDITAQITALENQKKAVDDLLDSLKPGAAKKAYEELMGQFDAAANLRKQMVPTFTDRYERPIVAGESQKEKEKYEPIDTTQLADMTGKIEANLLKIENAERSLQATTIDIGREIEGVFQNMAVGIGESLGNMIAGVEGYGSAGENLMGVLGDMAIQVGQISIAMGTSVIAIKASLTTMQGVGAIAAGIALVALGTAVKGSLAKAAGGGSGGSYAVGVYDTRSMSGGTNAMAGKQANALKVEVIGETSIRNKDIYIAYKNAETSRKIKT